MSARNDITERMLQIFKLHASIDNKEIIKGMDLTIRPGEIHVLLGPNGCGKSTLAYTLAGHPNYTVNIKNKISKSEQSRTHITLNEQNLLEMTPDQRAKAGLFLAFQNPQRLDGVGVLHFLRTSYNSIFPKEDLALFEFKQMVEKEAQELGLKPELLKRSVNDGFSGGERKRLEILQLRLLRPKIAIIDEIDSGLDVDAVKSVAQSIQKSVDEYSMGCLVITHYQRLLKYLKFDRVHVMVNGRIVASGRQELLEAVEKEGYKKYIS